MKSSLIILVSLAAASIAFAADSPAPAQAILASPPHPEGNQAELELSREDDRAEVEQVSASERDSEGEGDDDQQEDDLLVGYVIDISKKSMRGYDEDGRQEVVNVGPGMKTTADGQTRARTGPRGRQRGAVLPHKYIVRLKNGADFSSFDLDSRVSERNRLIKMPPAGENRQQQDGEENVEEEWIPNQVYHEYDFGTWKGYSGQFSAEFVKELEEHDEVEYVEEDKLMWAWGMDDQQDQLEDDQVTVRNEALDASNAPMLLEQAVVFGNETGNFASEGVPGSQPPQFNYYSLRAPSWGLTRISQRRRDLRNDYSYMSTAGADVDVYIIDSGVFAEHRDFEGRAVNLANFVPGEEDTDTCGHGTHVAGIVAGRHFGVAKSARINAIKVLDSEGQGSTSQVLAGINFMIRHAVANPNPKRIINMSLGGQYSRPVNEAVRLAVTKYNLPFFVAAGNTGDDACQYSPAGVEEAFAVGGSDSSAEELYSDLVQHSTQGIINGLAAFDRKTTRNLLYNKLEDPQDMKLVKPQDGIDMNKESEASVRKITKIKKKDARMRGRYGENSASVSPGSAGKGDASSTSSSSPNAHRHNYHDDPAAGFVAGSAASAAIESLLPSVSVSKKSVPGKSAEIVRASITLPGLNEQTDLEDWRAVLECTGARKIWDQMVDSSTVLMTLDDSTCITKTIFKTNWPASPRDALLIETTLLDHNAVLHIATSIKPSEDDPIFLRPSPPHVRAYLPLVVWHIQLVPADLDDTVSFTSFNSLTASQNKPVMPRHSIRVSFYYQIDMRGWAVNSSVFMQSHVPSCIANIYRFLRRQGVPPHVSRHNPRIQLDLNEYDPATGIYELRYDVIPADAEDSPVERKTISSTLKQFRLGGSAFEEVQDMVMDSGDSSNIPHEIVLSDDDEVDDIDNMHSDETSRNGYVDVELDGEKWGLGSDIVVHIFMNDIEDEEFVQEHVECLKYMGRDRYILRMKHTEIGSQLGAINVKLRIERIPQQQSSGGANLLSRQQLRHQLQQQEQQRQQQNEHQGVQSRPSTSDMNGLVVSVNGYEKDILLLQRTSTQGPKRVVMSLQEQLELSQQIVQEVDDSPPQWRSGLDNLDGQENRTTASPLLLMSTSMPTTMQSLNRSNQSFLSNGTSTMVPENSNPLKVNSSYNYFNSLLQEPASSWKAISKQRGVQISKLEAQGHAPGIVMGEGVFEGYTIWDIKAALDCTAARKIWDKMFDDSHMLQQVTPSSTLSYLRLKGFWPTSPKDMAVLNTTFVTKNAIHYFATSVDDTNLYPLIPPPVSPFVRSDLVVSGWYLETIKPQSVRVVYIAQAAPTGWMVPGTALGAMTTEMPLCVAEIIKYLEVHGSPPTLVSIRRGRALGVDYSHSKASFRLEYVQDSNLIFSGHRGTLQQQQQAHALDRQRRGTVDYTGAGFADSQQFSSPKLGPTDKLLAEIRLDARTWARNGDCEVTIDPPPSKVTCTCVPHDGTGYRLRIEHSSGRAVPAGGKVLLMARKPAKPGCGLVVNGVATKMPTMEHLETWQHHQAENDKGRTLSAADGALLEEDNQEEEEGDNSGDKASRKDLSSSSLGTKAASQLLTPNASSRISDPKRGPEPSRAPLQYAHNAMALLVKIMADSEESWTVVSDGKVGMRVTKRFMPAEISDQVPLVRGEKVIEGFSLDEIATVIGTLGTRSKLDSLYESGEMLESFGSGCATFHHVLKSYFPLPLPARDLIVVTATASAGVNARCPQIVIVSTSIPREEAVSDKALAADASAPPSTPASSKAHQPRPLAHLHLSAWILEGIDPYSSSHPIPSTRVTYMTALDLGGSVPQRISGMLQTTFPKMITQVEHYLQDQAAPPIMRIPEQMIAGPISDTASLDQSKQETTLQVPPVLPWIKPASRILSWEFKMKDSFFQVIMLFDQFRLHQARLDLATQRRIRKNKKSRRRSKGNSDSTAQSTSYGDDADIEADDKKEKTRNHTVLELIVDLKQYPMGYNIMTSIKVDPEFLLKQKQQRDQSKQQQQHLMASSTSGLKLAGSTSPTSFSTPPAPTSSKFIGGFDPNSSMSDGGRRSVDEDGSHDGRGLPVHSSEAASTGTGIAAVLGSSANVPRPLPSSTSLIRILPPPITVTVIDIPPAPSHSSSLSGVSKRRKHLIVITVPEAESSVSHMHSHQHQHPQSSSSAMAPKGITAHVVSGATAKPVVTASSVSGTTSTIFSAEDRVDSKQSRETSPASSLHDSDNGVDEGTDIFKPSFSPSRPPATPEHLSKQPATPESTDIETRMFQFGVKIDRLEHKDLDHQALEVVKDSLETTADEKEWSGKVMVDGLPAKVHTCWSRQQLGFLDSMIEDEVDESAERQQRKGSSSRNEAHNEAYSDDDMNARNSDDNEEDPARRRAEDGDRDGLRSRSIPRRKKHRHQQLANLQEGRDPALVTSPDGFDEPSPSQGRLQSAGSATNPRPTNSIFGLSNFLDLLSGGSQRGSRADLDAPDSKDRGAESDDQSSTIEYDDDLDDDRTIRASKSASRGQLSAVLSSTDRKGVQNHDHDLDLESLHGSIVFRDQGDTSDRVFSNDEEEAHQDVSDGRRTEREISDWARTSGSIRRRKGKDTLRDEDMNKDVRSSVDQAHDGGPRSGLDPRLESEERTSTELQYRRQNNRSSAQQRPRGSVVHATSRRHGSTNGADHPRFRGSKLYAYSFRNLFWSAMACFLVGLLLRIYVIGPSFLKTVYPSGGANSGSATYYYYYYAAPRKTGPSSSDRTQMPRPHDRGDEAVESTVWPQGIREVFTVRGVLGWDYVLLAYPSLKQDQGQE
ncbi:hypothetical protein BGZ98_004274 [Dissophora globulifera]|nr:hypothetical protein BGZ98_004274 [Dissophora globulifera]